jgi:hypothetical protein
VFPEKTLEFDGASLTFKNSPEATALVKRSYRKGWEIAGVQPAKTQTTKHKSQ